MNKQEQQEFKSRILSGKIIGEVNSPLVFNGAEIEEIKKESLHLENIVFNKLSVAFSRFDKAVIKNVVFNDCIVLKMRFDDAVLENVTFRNCKLHSFNPIGVNFKNTRFEDCEIKGASFYEAEGDVLISSSKLFDLSFGESKISWDIQNSTLEKIQAYEIQGRITLTNSTLKNANFEFGKMDSFDVINSTVTEVNGPGTINEHLTITGSKIEWVNVLRTASVRITNSEIERFGMGNGTVGSFEISDCGQVGRLGLGLASFDSISIKNCSIGALNLLDSKVGLLAMENATIENMEAEAASFGTWSAINTKLIDELEFQRTQVGRKSFSNVSVDSGAMLDMSGANFSFSD